MNFTWKWLGKLVLGKLHKIVDGLSEAQLMGIADSINNKIGGNKKVQYTSLKILIQVVKEILDIVA